MALSEAMQDHVRKLLADSSWAEVSPEPVAWAIDERHGLELHLIVNGLPCAIWEDRDFEDQPKLHDLSGAAMDEQFAEDGDFIWELYHGFIDEVDGRLTFIRNALRHEVLQDLREAFGFADESPISDASMKERLTQLLGRLDT